jgi:hypothetical protein
MGSMRPETGSKNIIITKLAIDMSQQGMSMPEVHKQMKLLRKKKLPELKKLAKELQMRQSKKEEVELDEDLEDVFPWLKKLKNKLFDKTHSTQLDKLSFEYAKRAAKELRDKKKVNHIVIIHDIAKVYKNLSDRVLKNHINDLVKKGMIPKDLRAEYEPELDPTEEYVPEARMSPLARLQKFDKERGSKIFKDKGGRKKWYRMSKPGLKSVMNVPEDELKKYLRQGWQIIEEAAEFTFKDLIERINLNQYISEKLPANADQSDYIKDFEKSDAPQFKGKSKEKRKDMAIAAYQASTRDEAKSPAIPAGNTGKAKTPGWAKTKSSVMTKSKLKSKLPSLPSWPPDFSSVPGIGPTIKRLNKIKKLKTDYSDMKKNTAKKMDKIKKFSDFVRQNESSNNPK